MKINNKTFKKMILIKKLNKFKKHKIIKRKLYFIKRKKK